MTVDTVTAIVLAGGSGTRFGAPVSKVWVDLAGRPVLAHSLEVLDASAAVDDVVVVLRASDRTSYDALVVPRGKIRAVVDGGGTRQASEWSGIRAAADIAAVSGLAPAAVVVLIHDAARPLVTAELVARLVQVVRAEGGGAIPAVPVTDVLLDARGAAVDVDGLVAVQTPQAFTLDVLLAAYPAAAVGGVEGADTAETVQAVTDVEVRWVAGDAANLKVTLPEDLAAAAAALARRRLD